MINDASQQHGDRWKYVDDLSLGENRHVGVQSQLQNQVDSLEEWSGNAGLKLNPDKCMTLTVCFMKNPPPPLPITLNGSVFKSVDVAKVLGLWLQSNLKWNKHISESTKKASKRLFMLRKLRAFCLPNYTDYASALQQCGLETLENRRVNLCRKFAVSMEKSERTADLLPPTRGQSTRRELRNSTKRTLPITRCPSKGRDVVCVSSWRALISALTYLEGKAREQPCSQLASFRATLNEAKAYGHHPLLGRMVLRALRPKEDEDIAKKFAAVAAHPLGPRFNPLGQARSVDFAKITGQVPLGTGRADQAAGRRTRQVKQVLD
ncbi:hypothetical protein Bbelb_292100 [Branchiostoma belcheri]|nr:hypothetical protein Bbelb_292100 [Branchiostoma belcheri]